MALPAIVVPAIISGLASFFGGKSKAQAVNASRQQDYELEKARVEREEADKNRRRELAAGLMRGLLAAYRGNPGVDAIAQTLGGSGTGAMDLLARYGAPSSNKYPEFYKTKGPGALASLFGGLEQAFYSRPGSGGSAKKPVGKATGQMTGIVDTSDPWWGG